MTQTWRPRPLADPQRISGSRPGATLSLVAQALAQTDNVISQGLIATACRGYPEAAISALARFLLALAETARFGGDQPRACRLIDFAYTCFDFAGVANPVANVPVQPDRAPEIVPAFASRPPYFHKSVAAPLAEAAAA